MLIMSRSNYNICGNYSLEYTCGVEIEMVWHSVGHYWTTKLVPDSLFKSMQPEF